VRKLLAIVGLLAALSFGCSDSSSKITASPTPKSATEALGCDFKLPNAMTKDRELTQASINAAVAAAPAAIRADLRVIYESSKKYQDKVKAAQAAPQSERPRMLQEASKDLNNAGYKASAQRLRDYFTRHCTGLQRRSPSPSP
jgi:hypothetical protein